jgi:hypothetical protein
MGAPAQVRGHGFDGNAAFQARLPSLVRQQQVFLERQQESLAPPKAE